MKETQQKIKLYMLILAGSLLLFGCGGEDLPPEVTAPRPMPRPVKPKAPPPKKEAPKYVYKGIKHRDPFIPLNAKRTLQAGSNKVIVPNIDSLMLKGIFDDGKQKMAIVTTGGISYILKGSRLYDNRKRLVKGVTGAIKKDSVIMIDSNKKSRSIKLREKEY